MQEKESHDLYYFMKEVTEEIASEYERIYKNASRDPGTAGDEGEENWAKVLRDWLPSTYHVQTKGRLIGTDGKMSPQVDVVVLKPSYPRKLLEKKIWLAEGVAAAFECKNTLTAAHVRSASEKSEKFKRLYRPRTGTPYRELRSPLVYGLLAHSHSWKSEQSGPVKNVEKELRAALASASAPKFELDLICVADLATWAHMYIARYDASWAPEEQSDYVTAFGGPCGPMTSIIRFSQDVDNQIQEFQPVGALISHLSKRLAWEDPSLRDIADYYRVANLAGSGEGEMHPWPLSVYSDEVRQRVLAGNLTNGVSWDEWSLSDG